MKKHEIENFDPEQFFNHIIEQPPLISEEQVELLLNSIPVTHAGSLARHFFQLRLNYLQLGVAVVFILVLAFFWIHSEHQAEKAALQDSRMKNQAVTVFPDTVSKETPAVIEKEVNQKTVNKEIVAKESSVKKAFDTIQTETPVSLSDIYKHFDKKPQKFLIQADRDTILVCKEGTTIKIKARSFVSGTNGNEIAGAVQIAVKEYYSLSDILLSNLTTTSGDKILETGGMVHIAATTDAENCMIRPGCHIEIGFPNSVKKEDMALFYGEQKNNIIDWQQPTRSKTIPVNELALADREVVEIFVQEESKHEVFIIVEEMPEFPGGEMALRNYLAQNIRYPYSALKDRIAGKVYVTFVVDSTGNIRDVKVIRGLDKILDKAAAYVVSNMPKWKPGKQRGRCVNVSYTVPVTFLPKNGEWTPEEIEQSKEFEEKLKNFSYKTTIISDYVEGQGAAEFEKKATTGNFQGITLSEVNRYLFSVTQLGWINCDRFSGNNNPLVHFFILTDNADKISVRAIMHRFKAIIPGRVQQGKISFENIPLGEKVTLVALKTVNNKIFLSVKETGLTKNGEMVLDFSPVTMEMLRKEMEKLNEYY